MDKIFKEIRNADNQIVFNRREKVGFPAHIHEEIELVYVIRGKATAFCDGKKYVLRENSFFLVFPDQVHQYSDEELGEYLVLIVKPSLLFSYEDVFLEGSPISALYTQSEEDNIGALFELSFEDYLREGYSAVTSAYFTAIFGKLLKHYKIDKSLASRNTTLRLLQYCSAHYKEKITVGEVARELSISRSTVSHIFSERLDINFCEYINTLRLRDAERLLANRSYSITQVSDMSGFSDVRSFNRVFLKKYGISPSAYRKKLN